MEMQSFKHSMGLQQLAQHPQTVTAETHPGSFAPLPQASSSIPAGPQIDLSGIQFGDGPWSATYSYADSGTPETYAILGEVLRADNGLDRSNLFEKLEAAELSLSDITRFDGGRRLINTEALSALGLQFTLGVDD